MPLLMKYKLMRAGFWLAVVGWLATIANQLLK